MKVIDLVSINKKEMPKCVKHYSGIYVWDKEEGDFFKGSGEGLLQWCVSTFNTQNHFIDEVEVIEEDKKIRKITLLGEEIKLGSLSNWLKDYTNNEEKIASCIECNAMKINEIIDRINSAN